MNAADSAKLATGIAWLRAAAEQADEAMDVPSPEILQQVLAAAVRRTLPAALDDDLLEILGMPNFRAAPIAHAFVRGDGAVIPPKAEAEQAFVLLWLLGLWFEHGSDWRAHAGRKIGELARKAKGEA